MRIPCLALAAGLSSLAPAQTPAVTLPAGDTVMLLENGRWDFIENYRDDLATAAAPLDTLATPLSTPAAATRVEKQLAGFYSIHYDSERWTSVDPSAINPMAQVCLRSAASDAFLLTIFEDTSLPLERYQALLMTNLDNGAERYSVDAQRYERVNGRLSLHTEVSATVQGLELVYHYLVQEREGHMLQVLGWRLAGSDAQEEALRELISGVD